MSTPALKPRPSAARTTQRVSGSRPGRAHRVGQVVLDLATLPARAEIAGQRFRADQYNAANEVLKLAGEARRQFYRTVAANQAVAFLEQSLAGAESTSILTQQLGETGALGKLEQAREHAFYSELGAQLAKARVQQRAERERLTRLLGLWGREIDFRLPKGLPALPKRLVDGRGLEGETVRRRADVQAARFELQSLAGQFGLVQATRFVSVFDLGFANQYARSRTFEGGASPKVDKDSLNGFSADLTIPLYDFGTTAVQGAQESYLAAANRLAERAVNARSEVREAYQRYRGQYDITRHYQTSVLPLRRTIQDQALLQYSGMLLDVTTLIIDARARILSNIQAIEAQRDFWIAATDLKAATVGGGFSAVAARPPAAPRARASPSGRPAVEPRRPAAPDIRRSIMTDISRRASWERAASCSPARPRSAAGSRPRTFRRRRSWTRRRCSRRSIRRAGRTTSRW